MNLLKSFKNLSPMGRVAVCLIGGATPLGILAMVGPRNVVLMLFMVMAFVGLVLLTFRIVLARIDKVKGKKLERGVKEQAAAAPVGVADAASRARMDELRTSWEEGIAKFRERGKDLYSVPWYLMVGESGSGKTEAIRHCNVGFPPGLQDKLQGSGGTLNMHWWFTNQSVIIDTAGRLLQESGRQEWRQFLRMMRKARPMRPINGLLLVIPADSLIKDTGDDLEKKGGRIASALDEIQEELGVRFPVYVIVTKCDLINGFREYFDAMPDPELKLQEQMVGWSNPQPLDEAFNPAVVEQHLKSVRDRLVNRRFQLMLDPVHTEDSTRRRIEQVDALYAFPDSLVALAPRLRRYLEMVFVAGEWSRRPLFIRGIYFTSSMQEGEALDAELAEALGVRVADLQQEQVAARREKTFFLRDVFVAKVFKEFGLVTAAVNIKKSQGAQRTMLLGTGFAAAALALGFTVWGWLTLQGAIGRSSEFWRDTAEKVGTNFESQAIVSIRTGTTYDYFGNETIDALGTSSNVALADLPAYTQRFAETEGNQRVPLIFRPVAMLTGGDPFRGQKEAHAAVFEGIALYPLVDAVRTKMRAEAAAGDAAPRPWTDEATEALAQLIRIESARVDRAALLVGAAMGDAAGALPAPGAAPPAVNAAQAQEAGRGVMTALGSARETGGVVSVGPLLRYALEGVSDLRVTPEALSAHIASLDEVARWTYTGGSGGGDRPWKGVAASLSSNEQHAQAVRAGVARFVGEWFSRSTGQSSEQLARLQRLRDALIGFDVAERALWEPLSMRNARTIEEYRLATQEWARLYEAVESANTALLLAIGDLGSSVDNVEPVVTAAQSQLLASARRAYDTLRAEIPGGTASAPLVDARTYPLLHEVDQQLRTGYTGIEQRVQQEIAAIRASLESLHTPLLSRIGGPSGQLAFARRFEMYRDANDQVVAAGPAGAPPTSTSIFELKATLDGVGGRLAAARAVLDRAVGDAGQADARFTSAAEVCRRAIDAAERKSRYDGIAGAFADLDDPAGMRAMVRAHVASSGLAPPTLRGLPMTDWTTDTQADPSFSPRSAKAAFDAVAAAGTMVGTTEDAGAAGVLESDRVRAMVERGNSAVRGYGREYVGYWTIEVPQRLSVREATTWPGFLQAMNEVDARREGDRIVQNAETMRTAIEAVPSGLLEERDRALAAAGLAAARYEIDQVGMSGAHLRKCNDLRQNFQSLSTDARAARAAVLAYERRELTEYFLSIFYLPEGRPEERVRYWSSMTLAGFNSLANETNRGARQALLSLRNVRRAFPLARDATTVLAASDLEAVIAEVELVGAAGTGVVPTTPGTGTTIGAGARIGDDEIDAALDVLRGRGLVTAELQPWFASVRSMVAALRRSSDGVPLTFEVVVLSGEDQQTLGGVEGMSAAGVYRFLDVVRGGQRQRFSTDNVGGVASNIANASGAQPVPNTEPIELWFYRTAQQAPGQPAEQRGLHRIPFGGDAWAALRAIADPGAQPVNPQGNVAREWRIPVALPNPQGAGSLRYWIGIRFNRDIPVPAQWWTTDRWPITN